MTGDKAGSSASKRSSDWRDNDAWGPEDLRRHPIWTWVDDDDPDSPFMPVELSHPIHDDDYVVFFVACKLVLPDGTAMDGFVGITLPEGDPYLLGFIRGNEMYEYARRAFKDLPGLAELAAWLDRPNEAMSPVGYATPFYLENGQQITGEVDLVAWDQYYLEMNSLLGR